MTVSNQTWRFQISGAGVHFPGIPVMAISDVKVVDIDNVTGQETAVSVGEYSLSMVAGTPPQNILLSITSAVPSGKTRWIYRETGDIQDVDYVLEGAFDSNAHERAIDRRTLLSIEHLNKIGILGFRVPLSESRTKPMILPPATVRASKVLGFDALGEPNAIVAVPAGSVVFTPNGQQLVEAANFAAMRALLDLEVGIDVQAADADLTAIAALAHVNGNVLTSSGGVWVSAAVPSQQMPRGHLWGLEMLRSGAQDLQIQVGEARDQANSQNMVLASALTKGIGGAWVLGNGGGNGDTILTNTWYHVFLIRRNSDGAIDAGYDRSPTAANLLALSAFNQYRRIGSVLRTTVPDIFLFVQDGDSFLWDTPPLDINDTNPGTGGLTRTLSVPPDVKVWALLKWVNWIGAVMGQYAVSSLDQADQAVADHNTNPPPTPTVDFYHDTGINTGVSGAQWVRTNTARQIRYRMRSSDATVTVKAATQGWIDGRGRVK